MLCKLAFMWRSDVTGASVGRVRHKSREVTFELFDAALTRDLLTILHEQRM